MHVNDNGKNLVEYYSSISVIVDLLLISIFKIRDLKRQHLNLKFGNSYIVKEAKISTGGSA